MNQYGWQLWIPGHEGGEWELPPIRQVPEPVQRVFKRLRQWCRNQFYQGFFWLWGMCWPSGLLRSWQPGSAGGYRILSEFAENAEDYPHLRGFIIKGGDVYDGLTEAKARQIKQLKTCLFNIKKQLTRNWVGCFGGAWWRGSVLFWQKQKKVAFCHRICHQNCNQT